MRSARGRSARRCGSPKRPRAAVSPSPGRASPGEELFLFLFLSALAALALVFATLAALPALALAARLVAPLSRTRAAAALLSPRLTLTKLSLLLTRHVSLLSCERRPWKTTESRRRFSVFALDAARAQALAAVAVALAVPLVGVVAQA